MIFSNRPVLVGICATLVALIGGSDDDPTQPRERWDEVSIEVAPGRFAVQADEGLARIVGRFIEPGCVGRC